MATVGQLEKIAKRLKIYSLKMTTMAGSGHPTTCLSMAELITCLFFDEMRYNIKEPLGYNNDEFILSKGHAAPILWAAYAEAGIIKDGELVALRNIHSNLEGHPTFRMPWIKAATGSLGQGLSVGVGLAAAMRLDGSNRRAYVILGDGECAEGGVWEAANSAANLRTNNLVAIVDVNRLGQSNSTMHGHDTKTYVKKFKAFGWEAMAIDGHSIPQILKALRKARTNKKPTAIIARTFKGHGLSFAENRNGWHGKPLNPAQLEDALFEIGPTPKINSKKLVKRPKSSKKTPKLLHSFKTPAMNYKTDEKVATREAFGHALVALGQVNQRIVAVDADVKNSTNVERFFKAYPERSFESFIAEQNMVGMGIGLSARGFIPFAATFACFLTRAHDQIRMAAYSKSNLKLVGSHVGVSIGPDGPSQMGLEDLAMFRPIPGCVVLYPSDAYSAYACTKLIGEHKGLAYLRTSRPKTPLIYSKGDKFKIGGSKVVKESKSDKVTVIAAGITVHNALEAYEDLKKKGIKIKIVDAYSIKPLDVAGINKATGKTGGRVVIVEDHFEEGGLGEAVKSALIDCSKLIHLCIRDLPRSGSPKELMQKYKISKGGVIRAVTKLS
jgi:transketolase